MRGKPSRPGYAMLLVLAFLVFFFAVLAVANSRLAVLLRAEKVRAHRAARDEGSTVALARGIALLETGYPPNDPYVCRVTIDTAEGSRSFRVTYHSNPGGVWLVGSAPLEGNENPPLMPVEFTSQAPPQPGS